MKTKTGQIEVQISTADGSDVAECIQVDVPLEWDDELQEWLLTGEAHQIIDDTKARHIGLISPAELKEMRLHLKLTQREIGALIQVGEKSYTRWETGRARPSRSINVLLCALRDGRLTIPYLQSLQKPVIEWWGSAYPTPVVVNLNSFLDRVPIEEPKAIAA